MRAGVGGYLALNQVLRRGSWRTNSLGTLLLFVAVTRASGDLNRHLNLQAIWRFALSEWQDKKTSTHFAEIIVEDIRSYIRPLLVETLAKELVTK